MNLRALEKALDDALIAYSDEMRSTFEEGDDTPAARDDLHQLSKTTFYLVDEFKKQIIKTLKENS